MKKVVINSRVWIWGIGVFVIICDILLGVWLHNILLRIYSAKYPDIYTGRYIIVPLVAYLLLLSPIIAEIILVLTYYMKNIKFSIGNVGILISLLPTSFLCYGLGFILFVLLPPISSHTTNIENYLVFDEEISEYEMDIYDFLPPEIPEEGENINYEYLMYESFFAKEFSIELSFSLPQTAYDSLKKDILESAKTIESKGEENTEYYISFTNKIQEDPVMIFKFDDTSRMIEYYIQGEKNI
ncbi:MAG TPA: hypothetical protein H9761_05720 [Candidatus Eisenbergiella merdavium]|uniref:Uncharacterized protein n=1 Tax=Candidatus Eisenbergiella merdavium TaxID=2838551 RepID=A0A9D2NF38_9FIRM|nr:hypothetical protein [Candidatus Eisenbergiella merdavium]